MNRFYSDYQPLFSDLSIPTKERDNNRNPNAVTDAETRTTNYKYSGQGKITDITDARQKTTKIDYGATGCPFCNGGVDKITAVRDANHVANNQPGTVYTYDKVGRLDSETDPMGKKTHYTYYDSNLLKEVYDATTTTPEKLLVTYKYNNRGQLTDKLYPDNTAVKYNYLPNGWLDSANNLTAGAVTFGYTFTYHANGRLKTITDTNGKTISYDLYDAIGRKKQVTYFPATPDQKQIIYNYDSANRLQTITSPAGVFTYGYDALSRRSTLLYPNQITATYGYDDLQRLTSVSHQYQATAIATYGYTLDQVGNRLTKSGTVNETYRYDEIYRLKEADTAKGTEKYGYDDVGNRLTGPGPKDTKYQYDTANRQTVGKLFGHDYDNQGNQTSRTTSNPDKSWTYTWDYENQLTKVEKGKGTDKLAVTFRYDPFGRRIEKKQSITKNSVTKTTTWTYVYDGYDIALEIMSDSATTKTFYTHGRNIDEHLALERNGNFYYFHQDGLGSVTAITDANRQKVQSYSYDSFGKITPQTSFQNSFTFTGREYDKETGLYYYRARYYDPMDGRFISKDPISFAGGDVNLFAYVQNNPINRIDPSGLIGEQYFQYIPAAWAYLNRVIASPVGQWLQFKGTSYTGMPKLGVCMDTAKRISKDIYDDWNKPPEIFPYPNSMLPPTPPLPYTLDQVGNRLTKSGTVNETYRYDEIYRLKEADTAKGTEKYGYDDVGNRLTGPGPKDTKYQYDTANRQTVGKLFGHDYDNQGNQTSRTTSNPDKSWIYTWDYENRLIKSEQSKGADNWTVTFKYDPFGRRIEKKLTTVIKGATKISTWTYVYDGYDIALEIYTDAASATTKT